MNIEDRPTDMLMRQLAANRFAARYRNPETGRRNFSHILPYRPFFVREMLAMRAELQKRAKQHNGANDANGSNRDAEVAPPI